MGYRIVVSIHGRPGVGHAEFKAVMKKIEADFVEQSVFALEWGQGKDHTPRKRNLRPRKMNLRLIKRNLRLRKRNLRLRKRHPSPRKRRRVD